MRHKGVNKDETRLRVTDAISRGFRKHGFAGVGVDALAKGAGVTSGAFYSHFGSKSGAFEVALGVGLDEVISGIPHYQREFGANWVKAFVDYYMGKAHREDLECGCAMASLTPEVVRAGTDMQAVFEEKMNVIVDIVARGLEAENHAAARARAWAMLAVLIGGLNLARAVQCRTTIGELANAIAAAAVAAAGPSCIVKDLTQSAPRAVPGPSSRA
ncbi:TetR/AcrR family transcriptional regulator [Massilia sp. DJPM01]|uniref:TetR/AcrR family transcriptional regulator n=1 Tax=Massilia sp. DJPM01 TaxID=3024404 RepID=UPI00259E98D6|nr:TetR/AcrR family transcriptional regulator [Massilia sp. DJPM01]MDM5177156.1 TetR/AcrR family transcriptional regulator [Massilia sp. DJPM01]